MPRSILGVPLTVMLAVFISVISSTGNFLASHYQLITALLIGSSDIIANVGVAEAFKYSCYIIGCASAGFI